MKRVFDPETGKFISPIVVTLSDDTVERAGGDEALLGTWVSQAASVDDPSESTDTDLDVLDSDGAPLSLHVRRRVGSLAVLKVSVQIETATEHEERKARTRAWLDDLARLAAEAAYPPGYLEEVRNGWADDDTPAAVLDDVEWVRDHSDFESMWASNDQVREYIARAREIVASTTDSPRVPAVMGAYAVLLATYGSQTYDDPQRVLEETAASRDSAESSLAWATRFEAGADWARGAIGDDAIREAHEAHERAEAARQSEILAQIAAEDAAREARRPPGEARRASLDALVADLTALHGAPDPAETAAFERLLSSEGDPRVIRLIDAAILRYGKTLDRFIDD